MPIVFKIVLTLTLWSLAFFSYAVYADSMALTEPKKPTLVLLKEYHPDLEVTGWLLSEKLDGVRAYWDGKQLLSRNGNRFMAPEWFTKKLPPFELDGELWVGRDRFQETVSIVRRQTPDMRWQICDGKILPIRFLRCQINKEVCWHVLMCYSVI